MRAKQPIIIVKYTNLWYSLYRRRHVRLKLHKNTKRSWTCLSKQLLTARVARTFHEEVNYKSKLAITAKLHRMYPGRTID